MQRIEPLHRVKTPARPGEWLDKHKEPGQTFEQYIRSNPNRPTRQRATIYLQPLGTFSQTQQKLLASTGELLSLYFNVPVKTLDGLGLETIPKFARRTNEATGKEQILSTHVLFDVLPKRRPADAVALLALTTADLWPGEGWNFVFGQASLSERVGIWSVARYGDADGGEEAYRLFRQRMFRVAVHETGHMLGILHCTAYECCLNGANHLAEMDSRPLYLCPEDAAKVWWACSANPAGRYAQLLKFANQHGMKEEAAYWQSAWERTGSGGD